MDQEKKSSAQDQQTENGSHESNVREFERPTPPSRKIRYAVVGLGYISQVAVLPAFAHANENSELAALFSGDPG